MVVSKIWNATNVNGDTNMRRKRQRYVLDNLLVNGRDFNFETPEAFIEVLGKVYVDARKNSNIIIHVINKNRLNGKLEILH